MDGERKGKSGGVKEVRRDTEERKVRGMRQKVGESRKADGE